MKLRGENLVKIYGNRKVVQSVSLEVNQGEIVGLLGPNGAGKTTTFYMVVGFVKPNEGSVYLDDEDITNLAMYKRAQKGVGYLPQEPSVFRKLTVEDNISAILEMTDLSKSEQKEKLESLIEEFGLQKVRKNIGDSLSGGERRRTEIARSLASSPLSLRTLPAFESDSSIAIKRCSVLINSSPRRPATLAALLSKLDVSWFRFGWLAPPLTLGSLLTSLSIICFS